MRQLVATYATAALDFTDDVLRLFKDDLLDEEDRNNMDSISRQIIQLQHRMATRHSTQRQRQPSIAPSSSSSSSIHTDAPARLTAEEFAELERTQQEQVERYNQEVQERVDRNELDLQLARDREYVPPPAYSTSGSSASQRI
ncbi:hypothetical protein VKT23_006080 [Stygiomarasmius scandens]|uniref:Uncharacterized protein n=1 Tax=Marasmiellus scandens TaxID=2682957 RepID=A0ABR1JS31_9AGAR